MYKAISYLHKYSKKQKKLINKARFDNIAIYNKLNFIKIRTMPNGNNELSIKY